MPLLLTESDVRRSLTLDDLLPAMERALIQFSSGHAVQPLRTVLAVGPDQAYCGVMPASVSAPAALGAKLVTIFERNADRGLPSHLATIVLLDPETGALRALMDGRYITAARTAAVSTVAARRLAATGANTLAVLGSGVQARSHIVAFAHGLGVVRVRLWSPTPEHRQRCAAEMSSEASVDVRLAEDAETAVRDASLIVLATSSTTPVIAHEWVAPGAHVTSVGAPVPTKREMDPDLVSRSRLIVDSREAALAESGDVAMGIAEGRFGADHVAGEIGEVLSDRVAGRTAPDQITIFKSLGLAVEDVAAADLAYRRARALGLGHRFDLG